MSIDSELVSGGLINFMNFFLKYISTRNGDYCFKNFARVFILVYRTRLDIIYSGGVFPAKRLDRRASAI